MCTWYPWGQSPGKGKNEGTVTFFLKVRSYYVALSCLVLFVQTRLALKSQRSTYV